MAVMICVLIAPAVADMGAFSCNLIPGDTHLSIHCYHGESATQIGILVKIDDNYISDFQCDKEKQTAPENPNPDYCKNPNAKLATVGIPYAQYDGKTGKLELFGSWDADAPSSSWSNRIEYPFTVEKPAEDAIEETSSGSAAIPDNIQEYTTQCPDAVIIGKAFEYPSGDETMKAKAKEEARQYARDRCPSHCKKGRLAAFNYQDGETYYIKGLQSCYDPRVWLAAGGVNMDTGKSDTGTISDTEKEKCETLCKEVYDDDKETLADVLIMNFERKEDLDGDIHFGCLCKFSSCTCCHIPDNELHPYRWTKSADKCTGDDSAKYGPGHTADPTLCTGAAFHEDDDGSVEGTCAVPTPVTPDCLHCCNTGTDDAPSWEWSATSCGGTEDPMWTKCCLTPSSDGTSCDVWQAGSGCNVVGDPEEYTIKGKVCCRVYGDVYSWLDVDPDLGVNCPVTERATNPAACGLPDDASVCCVLKKDDGTPEFKTLSRVDCSTQLDSRMGEMFSAEFCEMDIAGTCQGSLDLPEVHLFAKYGEKCKDGDDKRGVDCFKVAQHGEVCEASSLDHSFKVDPDEATELHVTGTKDGDTCAVTLVMSLTEPEAGSEPEPSICDGGATFGGSCYKETDGKHKWEDAKARCEELGAHLVTIDDALEDAFLQKTFHEDRWMGYNDREQEARYVWTTENTYDDLPDMCDGGAAHNGHCYKATGKMTWSNAKAKCEGWGGHLVTIQDDAENKFLKNAFHFEKWIGYSDTALEGTFVSVDQSAIDYNFWAGGEPNNCAGLLCISGEENCAEHYVNGGVNDAKCSDEQKGVCETSGGPPPTNRFYSNWHSGEPNNHNGNEDCGMFWSDGTWNDNGCGHEEKAICELDEGGDPGYVLRLFFDEDETKTKTEKLDRYDLTVAYLRLLESKSAAETGCLGCTVRHSFKDPYQEGDVSGKTYEVCIAQDPDLLTGCDRGACLEALKVHLGDNLISVEDGDTDNLKLFNVDGSVITIGSCSTDEICVGVDIRHIDITDYDGDEEQKTIASRLDKIKCEEGDIPEKNNFADYLNEVKTFQEGAHSFYEDLHANLVTMLDALDKQCESCKVALTDFLGTGYTASTSTGHQPLASGVTLTIGGAATTFTFDEMVTVSTWKDDANNDHPCKEAATGKGYQNIAVTRVQNSNDIKILFGTGPFGLASEDTINTMKVIVLAPDGAELIESTTCNIVRDGYAWKTTTPSDQPSDVPSVCNPGKFCACDAALGLETHVTEDYVASNAFGPELCHQGVQAICLKDSLTMCPARNSDIDARSEDLAIAMGCPVCIQLPCVAGVKVWDGNTGSVTCDASEMNEADDGNDGSCCDTSATDPDKYVCSAVEVPDASKDLGYTAATSNCALPTVDGNCQRCTNPCDDGCCGYCNNAETDTRSGVLEVKYRTNVAIVPAKLAECQQQVSDLKDLCTVDGAEDLFDEVKAGPCRTRDTVQNVVTTLKGLIDKLAEGIVAIDELIVEYDDSATEDGNAVSEDLIELNEKLEEVASAGSSEEFRKNLKNSVAMVDRIITDTADKNEQGTVTRYQGIEPMGVGGTEWKFKDECGEIINRYQELGYSGGCVYQPKYDLPHERDALIEPFYQRTLLYLTGQPEGSGPMSFIRDSGCIIDSTITSDKPIGKCIMGGTEDKTVKDQQFDDWGFKHDDALGKLNAIDSTTTPIGDKTLLYEIHSSCLTYATVAGPSVSMDDTTEDTDTDDTTDTGTDDSGTGTGDATGIGQGCNRNSDCPSGNCESSICCPNGFYCCLVDSHCSGFGTNAKCDTNNFYCRMTAGGSASPWPPKKDDGGDCDNSRECKSSNCMYNICCKRHEQCCDGSNPCPTGKMCCGQRHYCIDDPDYIDDYSIENGQPCSDPNKCISGNCKNGICCAGRAECCTSNSHCLESQNEVCDTSLHYCVQAQDTPPEDDPDAANPCDKFCRDSCDFGASGGRCHAELGYCVCDMGWNEWKGTGKRCDPAPIPQNVKEKMLACCESLFGFEPDIFDFDDPFDLEDTSGGECASAAGFNDGKVHFDKCRKSYSDFKNYCCFQGDKELPLTEKCYFQDEYASCRGACAVLYPNNVDACEDACKDVDVECEKACFEAPIPADSTSLLKCMRGEFTGMPDCDASEKVYQQIIGCFQRSPSSYSFAENVKCAQAKKGMLPKFTASALGIYKDYVQQTTIYGGDVVTAKADLTNVGALFFTGLVSFDVYVVPPCPETGCDFETFTDHLVLGTTLSKNEVNLIPSATVNLESEPFDAEESWIGNEVWAMVSVRGSGSTVGSFESKTGVTVLKMGVIAPEDAFFNEDRIITAYPSQEVTGYVKLTSEYFPLKADVYLTDTNNREIEGTRVSHTYSAKITDPVNIKSNTFTVPKEYAYFGNILRIGFEAFDKNDQLVAKSVLSTPVICDTCPEDYINVQMEYPDAYLKVESPVVKVTGANFIDADGEHIPATGLYQRRDVRAQVTVRNAVDILFDGTVKVTVLDESGTAITASTADLKDKPLAEDGKYTITTDALLAEEGHSYKILVHAVADDVDWFKRQLSRITYPYAVLDVQDLSTVQGEGPKDYTITYALGTCVLRVECTGCLPTCEILVDQPTCTFRSEGVCDPPGGTCSCIAAAA